MSALHLFNDIGGLPFWNETQILKREQCIATLALAMRNALVGMNPAWQMERIEGPTLTPREHVNPEYDDGDLFTLDAQIAGRPASMRAETTASSYAYARHLLRSGARKMPLCVWQAGKSYRREQNDGARASTLRFNEFWQCEFQCIYRTDTKANYAAAVIPAAQAAIAALVGGDTRVVPSDRLPGYSTQTDDIECQWRSGWKEMASISRRTDFDGAAVLEVAVGLDRLVLASEVVK